MNHKETDTRQLSKFNISNQQSQDSHPFCVSVEKYPRIQVCLQWYVFFFLSFLIIPLAPYRADIEAWLSPSEGAFQSPYDLVLSARRTVLLRRGIRFLNILSQLSSSFLYSKRENEVILYPYQMLSLSQKHSSVFIDWFCMVVLWSHI